MEFNESETAIADGNNVLAEGCDSADAGKEYDSRGVLSEANEEYSEELSEGENTDSGEEKEEKPALSDILEADYEELIAEFSELLSLGDITKMDGAIRYGELRELGLSPREAYLASRKRPARESRARAHLTPAMPHSARRSGISMPRSEFRIAREIFAGLSDSEIEALYKKVTRT